MRLHTYFRSSAAWRVRIAIALKNVTAEPVFVDLLRGGGEQFRLEYRAKNPVGLVPTLEVEAGRGLIQSLAIIE